MQQFTHLLEVRTAGSGLYEFTAKVSDWLKACSTRTGLLTIFVQHTSASLTVQENADPSVVKDIDDFFGRLVPQGDPLYRHTTEGPDDMPAHIRAALTLTQISIPVLDGRLALGTWQGIYLFEHRSSAQWRTLALHLFGD